MEPDLSTFERMGKIMNQKSPALYPLTASQRLLVFATQYCPKLQLLNIGTSIAVGGDIIEFDSLKKALTMAYDRCDAMRIRFRKNKEGETLQYLAEDAPCEVEYQDLSHLTNEAAKRALEKLTETPFDLYDSQENRIVMISMPDNFKGFYLNVNHLTMDSSSIIGYIIDVVQIYCHLKYEYAFPKPNVSYFDVLQQDLAYEANSPQQQKDKAFWEEFIARSEPIFTDITGPKNLNEVRQELGKPDYRACRIPCESVEAQHTEFHLEREPTSRLLDFCLSTRIPMVCLLLLGIRTFLSKMNGNERDISIKSAISRRGSVQKKKCGGSRIHCFPCRTILPPETTFMEALHIIQRTQFEIFRHADFDPVQVMNMTKEYYHLRPGEGYESLALTYQPMSMRANNIDMLSGIEYKTDWYSNGVAAQALYLTVMHNSIDEGMDFYYEYQPGRVSFQDLEYMYYYLCRIIFKGVENPDITIGEILETV